MSTKTKIISINASAATAPSVPLNPYPEEQHISMQYVPASAGIAAVNWQVSLEDASASTNWFDVTDSTAGAHFSNINIVAKNLRLNVSTVSADASAAGSANTMVAHVMQAGV